MLARRSKRPEIDVILHSPPMRTEAHTKHHEEMPSIMPSEKAIRGIGYYIILTSYMARLPSLRPDSEITRQAET